MPSRVAALIFGLVTSILLTTPSIASTTEPIPFQFEAATTPNGQVLPAMTGYDAVFTSSVGEVAVRFPTLSGAQPALQAFAVAEPVADIAFIAGLAALAMVRRRRGGIVRPRR